MTFKLVMESHFMKDRDPVTYYIHKLIRENKNFLCPILGQTGAGKSWTGLRLCENVDPEFNINRVIFDSPSFMQLINSGELHKGSAILFDEAGVNVSNRQWYSKENIALGKVVETFRHRNYIVFFTVPNIDFIDIKLRKLMHGRMNILSRDSAKGITIGRLLIYDGVTYDGEQMTKYLKVTTKKGVRRISRIYIPKPSKELIREYEKRKNIFTTKINREVESILTKKPELLMKDIQFEIIDLYKNGMEILDIARKLDLPLTTVSKMINLGVGKDIVRINERKKTEEMILKQTPKPKKRYGIENGRVILLTNDNILQQSNNTFNENV